MSLGRKLIQMDVGDHPFFVRRDTWDGYVVTEVNLQDRYRIREMAKQGFKPRGAVEIGAHIGAFTCLVKSTWPGISVVAFEADPDNYKVAKLNAALYEKVHMHNSVLHLSPGHSYVKKAKNPRDTAGTQVVKEETPIRVPRENLSGSLSIFRNRAIDLVKVNGGDETAENLFRWMSNASVWPKIVVGRWEQRDEKLLRLVNGRYNLEEGPAGYFWAVRR